MCEICHQTFCPEGCPNYQPKLSGLICEECGEPIPVGAVYWDYNGFAVCDDCMQRLDANDILERTGHSLSDLLEFLDIRQMEAEAAIHED